jgi:hypothetical protein
MKIKCAMEDARIENGIDGSETAEGRIRLIQIEAMAFTNTAITSIELPEHVVSVSCTALPEACRIIYFDSTFSCASFREKVGALCRIVSAGLATRFLVDTGEK